MVLIRLVTHILKRVFLMLFILLNYDLIWFSFLIWNLELIRHTEQTVSGECSIALFLCVQACGCMVWKSQVSLAPPEKQFQVLQFCKMIRFSSAELFLNVPAFSSVGKTKEDALSQHKILNNFNFFNSQCTLFHRK